MKTSIFSVRVWNFIKLTLVLFLLGGFLLYELGAAAAAMKSIYHIQCFASRFIFRKIHIYKASKMLQYWEDFQNTSQLKFMKIN